MVRVAQKEEKNNRKKNVPSYVYVRTRSRAAQKKEKYNRKNNVPSHVFTRSRCGNPRIGFASSHLKEIALLRICKAYRSIHYVTSWDCKKYPIIQVARVLYNKKNREVKDIEPELDIPFEIQTNSSWQDGWHISTIKKRKIIKKWIPFEQYRQPLMSHVALKKKNKKKGKFDETKHYGGDKFAANSSWTRLLREHPRDSRELVMLDNVTQGLTTHSVLGALDLSADRIHVPDLVYNAPINKWIKEKASFYQGTTVYAFFRDLDDSLTTTFDFGGDYCCTFDGNESDTKPKLDIELIFCKERFPKHNGVMWLTFSCRAHAKSREDTLRNVKNFVIRKGKQNGYRMIFKEKLEYKTMLSVYFVSSQSE